MTNTNHRYNAYQRCMNPGCARYDQPGQNLVERRRVELPNGLYGHEYSCVHCGSTNVLSSTVYTLEYSPMN